MRVETSAWASDFKEAPAETNVAERKPAESSGSAVVLRTDATSTNATGYLLVCFTSVVMLDMSVGRSRAQGYWTCVAVTTTLVYPRNRSSRAPSGGSGNNSQALI